jgi:hypothetical protein
MKALQTLFRKPRQKSLGERIAEMHKNHPMPSRCDEAGDQCCLVKGHKGDHRSMRALV